MKSMSLDDLVINMQETSQKLKEKFLEYERRSNSSQNFPQFIIDKINSNIEKILQVNIYILLFYFIFRLRSILEIKMI